MKAENKIRVLTMMLLALAAPWAGWTQGSIPPGPTLQAGSGEARTADQMIAAETSGRMAVAAQGAAIPFRPTIPEASYTAAKAASAAAARISRTGSTSAAASTPPALVLDGEGVNQITAQGWFPPDTEGAVGLSQFVEVVNDHIDVYEKSDLAPLDLSVSLNSFFGYSVTALFDPRVIYDGTWNRWIITADSFPDSQTPPVQLYFFAISVGPNAAGPYYIYAVKVNFADDDFWDYPQLGMDQNSILFTANVFGPTTFRGARAFAIAKSRLYNGLGFSVPVFVNLCGTLAPPIVLDQNASTYLVCAPPAGNAVTKYTMQHSSEPNATTLNASAITVSSYTLPRSADQPGTDAKLDSLDARFVNTSAQVGNSLWQVHTVAFPASGAPTPRFYEFDTTANTIKQTGYFFADNFSDDFNASIAADPSNTRVYVTWSSTNALKGTNAQVRFSGCKPAAGCVLDTTVPDEITSKTFSRLGRWGDYSAVTVDPQDPDAAFLVNEYIIDNTTWGSRIAQIHFP